MEQFLDAILRLAGLGHFAPCGIWTAHRWHTSIFARGLGVLNLGYRAARCFVTFPSEGLATRGKSCFTVHIIFFFHVVTM